jgi:hypothetical protein
MHRVEVALSAAASHAQAAQRARHAAAYAVVYALLCGALPRAQAETPAALGFAVVSSALGKPADETSVRHMLDAIGHERETSFVVYDGNLKGETEACRDSVYEARRELLDASPKPVVLLPGEHDWVDCGQTRAGGYDPVERLDFLRQTFFGESESLGQSPMSLTRESGVARFRPFRENVRWQENGVAFVGLNAPSPNNHYLNAGGRNGEFEDRSVANGFWLEHAVESARRSDMRAVVVILQGDPDFTRYERRDRFAWLRFSRGDQARDGFLELKRSLVRIAEAFRGPVIVIHGSETPLPNGFRIDQPLRNDRGAVVPNLTRIAIGLKKPQSQWLELHANFAWRQPFRVRVRDVVVRSATPGNTVVPPASVTGPISAPASASAASTIESSTPGPSSFFQQMQPVQPAAPSQPAPSNSAAQTSPASQPVQPGQPAQPTPAVPFKPDQAASASLPPLLGGQPDLPPILPSPSSGAASNHAGASQ